MPLYECVKAQGIGTRSVWLGDKEGGQRVTIVPGRQYELTAKQAAQFGNSLVEVDEAGNTTSGIGPGTVNGPAGTAKGVPKGAIPYTMPNEVPEGTPVVEGGSLGEDEMSALLEGTVADVSDTISGMDNTEELQALRDAEEEGKGRKGVLDAIDARLEAL